MRAFFLLLVLANLGFLAWANLVSESDTQSDPRPLARQVAPEKLRIVPPSALPAPALAGATPAPTAAPSTPTPTAAPSTPTAAPSTPAAAPPATSVAVACLEWGAIAAADNARATEALAALALGARLSERAIEDNASWWVFIAPRANRQDAQKKAAELRALGIDEYFIVQDEGPQHWAISLGVFKTEASAYARLEALRTRGVRTAQAGKRDTLMQKTYFQVRPAEDSLAGKMRGIAQSFPGTEVRECAPGPARG